MFRPAALTLLFALATATAARAEYTATDTKGLTWSDGTTTMTPEGGAVFHGEFGNKAVTAALEKIPPHDFLQISLQLLIIRSWDGVSRANGGPRIGPDCFRLSLDDGEASPQRTLVFATFSNTPVMPGFNPENNFQTYPSPLPGDRCPYMTGADFKNNFGYLYPLGGNQPPFPVHMDSVYTIKMTLPHTAENAVLNFRGVGLQTVPDESWGVMNVRLLPRTKEQLSPSIPDNPHADIFIDADGTEIKLPAPPSMEQLLQTALGHEATTASDAFWKLAAAGDATVDYLQHNTKPRKLDLEKIKALVEPLYADDPPADEKDPRVQAVLKLGITSEPALRDLRQEKNETPSRLDWVFIEQAVAPIQDPDTRQWILATRLLEAMGTPAAKKARATLMGQ